VVKGKIVDGVGGTMGGLGYMGMGGMDGELAYALANTLTDFSKLMLFKGGAVSISQIDPQKVSIEEFVNIARRGVEPAKLAYSAMLESIIKGTYLMLSSVRKPKELLLSGRFARIDTFVRDVTSLLRDHLGELGINAEIRTLKRTGGTVKEAAEGAAIIANGIAGGRYERLIENMELRKSSGGVFSHIYLDTKVRERIEETFAR
jgi:predicted butyrate kinase (DUF1464 family)